MKAANHKYSRAKLWRFANAFCGLKSSNELADLLHLEKKDFRWQTECPTYDVFETPKKQGGFRTIENPSEELKKTQKRLNFYLQACYYFSKTTASYGFVTTTTEETKPRDIKTNAQQHRGRPWMLNIDFKEFFHQVTYERVVEIFEDHPFGFSEELSHTLAKLTTYQNRLPMGTATSPALSNFACTSLDADLLTHARLNRQTYTRYADDLTFSGYEEISHADTQALIDRCQAHGFAVNPNKVHVFSPTETKIVTGLVVGDTAVSLPPDYLPKLRGEMGKLSALHELKYRMGGFSADWMTRYKQKIKGSIAFVGFVNGKHDSEYLALLAEFEGITTTTDHFDPVSWLDFGYQF